jgi:hypothetical protein
MAEELDIEVARDVFGLSQQQIDTWPFGVPAFSSDRSAAAQVICRLWPSDVRPIFEKHLEARLPRLHGGLAETVMVATPDEICRAALSAVREYGATV